VTSAIPRPAHPASQNLDSRFRQAILEWARRRGITAERIWIAYREREAFATPEHCLGQTEIRYGRSVGELTAAFHATLGERVHAGSVAAHGAVEEQQEGIAEVILLVLPDEEFLAAAECAPLVASGASIPQAGVDGVDGADGTQLLDYLGQALETNMLPWRASVTEGVRWEGAAEHIAPAVSSARTALSDQRLASAEQDFTEALRQRRKGDAKAIEHAVVSAAKAVESVMKVIVLERELTVKEENAEALCNKLTQEKIIPGYYRHLILACPQLRNREGAHGSATPRVVSADVADAAIATAASAITLLARVL
jgi:hypothetical protein